MNAPESKVDVLAVLDLAYRHLNGGGDTLTATEFGQAHAGMKEVRAAVAELIEAARECLDTELGEMACLGSVAPCEDALGKLKAAIARVGGA